jgi:choline dehydrogenase
VEAIQVSREILAQPAFAPYDGGEASPGPDVQTEKQVLEWVAKHAVSAMHYAGSCRMGTGEDAGRKPARSWCSSWQFSL